MNPTLSPYPNQQPSPFFSAIPNPNHYVIPNLTHHNPFAHNPPPSVALPTTGDLSTTIANLKSLIDLSHQTLTSISKFLPLKPHDDGLIQCPFNPNHRLPPESLFGHYLRCPTSLDLSSVVESLHYPKTLKPTEEAAIRNPFVVDPNAELCFTLEGYSDFMSNIFYSDCPGVITFPCKDEVSKRTFTMPAFLSVECTNFVSNGNIEVEGTDKTLLQILPSEVLGIENEIGTWNDCPGTCSYSVVSALSGLQNVKDCDLGKWVITNSPKFGVVIDVSMREHISLLYCICLKAIVREAINLVKDNGKTRLDCPILVRAITWLASQFSVLYGEIQGKCFALDLLKKSILDSASYLSLYPYGKQNSPDLADGHGVKSSLEMEEGEFGSLAVQTVYQKKIFVSQVVSAVAALHERSLLEQKIRALRQLQPPPRYQRVIEYSDISTRADDERKKRPTYRPIIDHDGLPRQAPSMQETGKTKTREELLAEERDYKRRRMSYRGKKSKRNPSEVVRDIIEEFMEEIKKAGGIGCFEKGPDIEIFPPEPPSSFNDQRKNNIAKDRAANSSGTQLETGPERKNRRKSDDNRQRERHDMEGNRGRSREFERSSSVRSRYNDHISSSRNDLKEDGRKSRSRDKRRRNDHVNGFEDRYDPSRSDD